MDALLAVAMPASFCDADNRWPALRLPGGRRRSSSSIWYELSFSESYNLVKRSDRVWQIAFGSGFKCNSVIWKALRNIRDTTRRGFWDDVEGLPAEYKAVLDELRKQS